jgi:propanol-preferring alcohol dehydrogenase
VQPGESVGVFRIGGLGHLALQYARIVGGIVVAVDIEDEKLRLATELGADHVVNARTTDPVAAIRDLGGIDVAVALRLEGRGRDAPRRRGRRPLHRLPRQGQHAVRS